FRSIWKPSSLLALSVQANWSWPAPAWLCQLTVMGSKKKIRMKDLKRLLLELTLSHHAAADHQGLKDDSVSLATISAISVKVKRGEQFGVSCSAKGTLFRGMQLRKEI